MNFFKIILVFTFAVFLIPSVSFGFIGPGTQSPGTGSGLLQITSDRNIGFGTSDSAPGNKAESVPWGYLFTIASSSNPGLSIFNTGGGKRYIIYSHNSGALGIHDTTPVTGGVRFRIAPNGRIAIGGTTAPDELLHVFGTAKANLFSGDGSSLLSLTPGNITASAFAPGSYAFRGQLAIGTSTTAGLPAGGLYVDGRVGIGTTNPDASLHVKGASGDGVLKLWNNAESQKLRIDQNSIRGETSNDISIFTLNNAFQLYLEQANGNVGIGTASPSEKLHVNGLIRIERATATDNDSPGITAVSNDDFLYNGVYLNHYGLGFHTPINQTNRGVYASGYFGIDLFTQGTNRLSILQNGYVGIATTTPASPLTVVGTIESTSGGFKFPDGTTQTSAVGSGESGWTDDGATVRLTDIGDSVGIGTASPDVKLHVFGTGDQLKLENSNSWASFNDGDTITGIAMDAVTDDFLGSLDIRKNTTAVGAVDFVVRIDGGSGVGNKDRFFVDGNSGNVGIGTGSPGELLEIYGNTQNIRINNTAETEAGIIFEDAQGGGLQYAKVLFNSNDVSPNNLLNFYVDSATAAMTINGSGNVGIGTTNPTSTLVVAGNIYLPTAGRIINLGTPLNGNEAATKSYVDSTVGGGTFWAQSGSNLYPENLTWNVGIGTASPAAQLHVDKTSDLLTTPLLSVSSDSGNITIPRVVFQTTGDGRVFRVQSATNRTDMAIMDVVNSVGTVFSIRGDGNVGIGTASPGSGLHVNSSSYRGQILVERSGSGYYLTQSGTSALFEPYGSTDSFGIFNNTTFKVESGGNIGIGTTGPGYKLEVAGTFSADSRKITTDNLGNITAESFFDRTNSLFMLDPSDTGTSLNVAGVINANGTGNNYFIGNVGIGTTGPLGLVSLGQSNYGLGSTPGIVIRNNTTPAGAYSSEPAWSRKWFLHVTTAGDVLQNDTYAKTIRLQLPASYAGANSTYGRIKISYLQGHNAGNYSAEFTFVEHYAGGTTNYVTWDFGTFRVQKTNQTAVVAGGYMNATQLDYIRDNLKFYRHRPSSGYDSQSAALVFKLPNSGTSRVVDIAIEVEMFGRSGYESAIKIEDLGTWTANAPVADLTELTVTELFVGSRNASEIYTTSNVGIGTTGPDGKLDVAGTLNVGANDRVSLWECAAGGGCFAIDNSVGTRVVQLRGDSAVNYINNGGNVGIGTVNPNAKLNIVHNSSAIFRMKRSSNDWGFEIGGSDGIGLYNYAGSNFAWWVKNNGNVGINTINPTTALEIKGELTFTNIGGGDYIDVTGGNIVGVNKLSVATIDPLYNIGGTKYATYVASIVGGVKEEYVAKAELSLMNHESGIMNYEYVIDFSRVEEGSDLWLWRKTVDFSRENVEVLATPYKVPVPVAYEIDGNRIIFRAVVHDSLFMIPDSITFSYRLVGKRFDWQKWPTLAPNQNEKAGLIIK